MRSTNSPSGDPGGARGSQRPRIFHAPEFSDSAADDAIELAAMAGLVLDDWQQFVLRHALGERSDGNWATPTVGLVCPRQNGKNAILEARELAGLFLFGEGVIVHSAHEQATASEQFRRLEGLIRGVPQFERRLAKVVRGKGSEAIELTSGQRILFKTRTGGGGRGFSIDCVVFDEAYELPETAISAIVPALSARPNTQRWYTSSAVDQDKHANGVALARVRERGLRRSPGVAYFEWSAEGDDPARVPEIVRADRGVWAQANPSLGERILPETVQDECDGGMGAREFAVERLGVGDWPDTSGDSGRVIAAATWAALAEHDPENRVEGREAFAIDTNVDQTWGSIGVAGQRADERWQVHVVKHARGKDWIVGACQQLREEHPDARFIVDPRGPAANLISDLRDVGIEPVEVSAQDYGTACADFVAVAVEDRLRYPAPDPSLSDAVADARKGPLGDRWKWSRKNSTSSDISPLVACTLALWGAMNAESEYTTVLYARDEAPVGGEDPEIGPSYHQIGPGPPRVLAPEDYTTCFACRVGGCTIHDNGG